ncbi:MAG TPA: hypothetical protein VIL03_00135 [Clostridia bacterium]|jgi:hypothetical protein
MAYCPNCGREGNSFCSFCGAQLYIEPELPKESSAAKPNLFYIILSALCFIAGLIVFAIYCAQPEGKVYIKYAGLSALVYIIAFSALIIFLP